MNLKALLLSAVLGFACAWAPGCSDSKCSPRNCSTCCDAKGVCVASPQNTTSNSCGAGGATCTYCSTNESCTDGQCVAPKKVGDACRADAECTALGANAVCKKATSSGMGTYLDGYCTLLCEAAPESCPSGSACLLPASRYGETDAICWNLCSLAEPCRSPGYACYAIRDQFNACWIDPLPYDAGPAADKVGNPCSVDEECQNPPASGGICLLSGLGEIWPQGYCSKLECVSNEECAADGGGVCFAFGEIHACTQRCVPLSDGGLWEANCRPSYQCYPTGLDDGGVEGHCAPEPRPIFTTVGDPCMNNSACQAPYRATATCTSSTQADGGPTGWTDGYCTRLSCLTAYDCSQDGGGECLTTQASFSSCFRTCTSPGTGQSTCRNGYVCEELPADDGGTLSHGFCDRACTAAGAPECPSGKTCEISTGYCK